MSENHTNKRSSGDQYIIFEVGSTSFGVPILQALRITKVLPITRVPGAPSFLEGIVNDQSTVIPIIDLRKRLDLSDEPTESADNARILMVEVDNQVIGMLVTAVVGIVRIHASDIQPTPNIVTQINGVYLTGVYRSDTQITMIIELDQLLTIEEITDTDKWKQGVSIE
jgi:purine-binding chemotaxis protein CheW